MSRRIGRTPLDGGCGTRRTRPSEAPRAPTAGSDSGHEVCAWANDRVTPGSDARPFGPIHAEKNARKIWPDPPIRRVVERMLIIALGIALSLVAMDVMEITRVRKP